MKKSLERYPVVYPVEQLLPRLKGIDPKNKINEYMTIADGVKVKLTSERHAVFQKSSKCCCCGLEGQYFAVERNVGNVTWHLNLYGVDENQEEILLTKDHIVPVVNGGKNSFDNYRTMCVVCNSLRGQNLMFDEKATLVVVKNIIFMEKSRSIDFVHVNGIKTPFFVNRGDFKVDDKVVCFYNGVKFAVGGKHDEKCNTLKKAFVGNVECYVVNWKKMFNYTTAGFLLPISCFDGLSERMEFDDVSEFVGLINK